MNVKCALLAGLLLLVLPLTAAAQTMVWDQDYGGAKNDRANAVVTLPDSGSIIVGYTSSSGAGKADVLMLKIDQFGNEQWSKTFGGSYDDFGFDVILTSDSNLVVAGYSASFSPKTQIYVIKTDLEGTLIWSRIFGGALDEYGFSLVEASDSGYVIAGETYSYGSGWGDVFLVKVDKAGIQEWIKYYGGPGIDWGQDIALTSDGGFIITGCTNSFGSGSYDGYLLRLDSNGDSLWAQAYGSAGLDAGRAVVETFGASFVAGGITYRGTAKANDAYLVSTDLDGGFLWEMVIGGSGDEHVNDLLLLKNGKLLGVGETSSSGSGAADFLLLKFNVDGDSVTSMTYGAEQDEEAMALREVGDEGAVIVGSSNSFGSQAQVYALRFDHDFLCGDADGDGKYSIGDAVYIIAYIFGGGPDPFPLKSGNFDCAGAVNMADVVAMIAWIFGSGPGPCEDCESD